MTITAPISDEQFETLLSNIAPESAQAFLRARDTTQRAALARYETVLDGLPLDAIDGGWTAAGISKRLKATEDALARVEAEAGRLAEAGLAAQVKATTAQAELAEMRRIVAGFLFNYDDGVGKPWERRLLEYARKRVDAKEFNAQAEQQEAKPVAVAVEAQGAQAGDDVIKLFERIISQSPADLDKATEENPWYQVMASEVRAFAAALATQPAAGEPTGWRLVPIEPLLGMMSDKDHDTRIDSERTLLAMLDKAPPAFAHGDEAATLAKALSLLWKTTNFLPRGGSLDGRVSAFLAQHAPEPVASAAAMHAQGDGEVL